MHSTSFPHKGWGPSLFQWSSLGWLRWNLPTSQHYFLTSLAETQDPLRALLVPCLIQFDLNTLLSSKSSPSIFLWPFLWLLPPRASDLQAERPFVIWLLPSTHLNSAGEERLSGWDQTILFWLGAIVQYSLNSSWPEAITQKCDTLLYG